MYIVRPWIATTADLSTIIRRRSKSSKVVDVICYEADCQGRRLSVSSVRSVRWSARLLRTRDEIGVELTPICAAEAIVKD
jgi:hypothetical protein